MHTENTNYIYKNDLDKACFQNDMACGKYKYLTKITQSNKVLRQNAFEIASNPKYDKYEKVLPSMVTSLLIKNLLKAANWSCWYTINKQI